ncbi:6-phosphogluconolactonase [Leucobacter sp. USCH14]|uniref:6-phosphogluconolactonase n=1 Tax=Leucobacter sp. USCH14 TaxID=3024838 RepID=UPI0030B35E9B
MRVAEYRSLDDLAPAVASEFVSVCRERQRDGGVPCAVLTGGSGGERVLEALAAHPGRDTVDWARVRFLWGDERWAPAGHADRNDLLADRTLFRAVTVDPALVHRVAASDSGVTLDAAAAEYADVVESVGRIDLALNGVGPDGHIASLFPGREELEAVGSEAPMALAIRHSPKPPPERVTVTLPALSRAERVWLIAAGEAKAAAIGHVLAEREPLLPAARVSGSVETVLWADTAALGASAASSS